MRGDPDEPIFVRSRWGTNHYVFNWRNPIGRFLIVATLIAAAAALVWLYSN
ncbi:hypothetical protein ACQPZP_02395 [Spirillospora sp. CA-142024]|uniref:hypothetical protein n=1 Tax=Spirillospora sp. CA-142024 TaxID=3240036 RepID=UPI003D8CA51C